MKPTILILTMLIACTAAVFASPADEEQLKTLELQWLDAYVKADTAFLKTVEAENWTFVDSDGSTMTRAQDIKELGDKTFVCKSASMSDAKVNMLDDNHAYVTGLVKMAGTYKGKDFSGDFRGVDIFEKKDGKWQVVYSHITKVGKNKD